MVPFEVHLKSVLYTHTCNPISWLNYPGVRFGCTRLCLKPGQSTMLFRGKNPTGINSVFLKKTATT